MCTISPQHTLINIHGEFYYLIKLLGHQFYWESKTLTVTGIPSKIKIAR